MRRTVEQHTWSGFGVHTGRRTHVHVMPAPAGVGVRLHGEPVDIRRVTTDDHATGLPGALTIEHLLAALRMAGVDDVDIKVVGGEVPCLDGSAAPFLEQLVVVEQGGEPDPPLVLEREVVVEEGHRRLVARPAARGSLRVTISFDGISELSSTIDLWIEDAAMVARARTFTTQRLLGELRKCGLGLGVGRLRGAHVLVWYDQLLLWRPALHSPTEPVMHKWLDLYADLSLLGRPLIARVEAIRPGHRLNHELVRALWKELRCS